MLRREFDMGIDKKNTFMRTILKKEEWWVNYVGLKINKLIKVKS